jgi:hypothetical protein
MGRRDLTHVAKMAGFGGPRGRLATTTSCRDYFDVYKTTASKGLTYSITHLYFDIETIG